MSDPAFSLLREGEEQKALDVLVTAFIADPVLRWMYPDASGYLTRFPAFLRAFGGKAFTSRTVWRFGDFEWTYSRSSSRWTRPIRRSRIGTCHGSVSRALDRARASAAS